jgi:hypothetical protein
MDVIQMIVEMQCPWSGWDPSNFDFNEQNVCGWVVELANTYYEKNLYKHSESYFKR